MSGRRRLGSRPAPDRAFRGAFVDTPGSCELTPRVLFVGSTRYSLPLQPGLERKFTALERELDYRVLARGNGKHPRFRLLPSGTAFYGRLPVHLRRELVSFRPDVVVAEDPRTAAIVMLVRAVVRGSRPRVIAEVHGNWRHATRLYGSQARQTLAPLVDMFDRYGLRHADAVRALSPYTAGLVEVERGSPPDAAFPTYSDLSVFAARPVRPLPKRAVALFVGVLEPYKNVEGLVAAWKRVAPQVPAAQLVVVGNGPQRPVVQRLAAEFPGRVEHVAELPPEGVAQRLDEATVLVLPSRFEGLGRVVIEAFARGRGVVASRAGGILDLVEDGREGLLVDVDDVEGLAAALVRVLSDRALADRLGAAARERFPDWSQSAEEWAERTRTLVDATLR
jgi:glycosyltransferase involved in cell wall biosynthesis